MVSSFSNRKRLVLLIYDIYLNFKVLEIYFYLVKSAKNTANQSDEEAEKVSKKMAYKNLNPALCVGMRQCHKILNREGRCYS